MLVRDAIIEAWEVNGEPTDLDPFLAGALNTDPANLDPTTTGVRYYLRELSAAQVALANWRTTTRRPIRFDKFQTQRNVKLGLSETDKTFVAVKLDEYSIRIAAPPVWFTEELLESASVTVEQDYTNALGVPTTESDTLMAMISQTTPAGNMEIQFRDPITLPPAAVTATRAVFVFDRYVIDRTGGVANGSSVVMPAEMRNVTRITTASDGAVLNKAEYKEDLYNSFLTSGSPSLWYGLGDRIFFDTYLEDPTWFTFEYQRLPVQLTYLDQAFDIPVEWQHVLVMIVEWKGAKRLQETEKEMMLKSQLNSLINQMRTDDEEKYLRNQTGGFYIRREAR